MHILLLCFFFPALSSYDQSNDRSVIIVEPEIVVDENGKIEPKKTEEYWRFDSRLVCWQDGTWKDGGILWRLGHQDMEGGKTIIGWKLSPGKWKYIHEGTYRMPYRCESEFELRASEGAVQKVRLVHTLREKMRGTIKIVNAEGGGPVTGPLSFLVEDRMKTVDAETVIQGKPSTNEGQVVHATSEGGIAFWFWKDYDSISLRVNEYRYSGSDAPLIRKFTREELGKGTTWAIRERPAQLSLVVKFRTRNGDIGYDKREIASLFPGKNVDNIRFFVYPTSEDARYLGGAICDPGGFDKEAGVNTFRSLKPGGEYVLVPFVMIDDIKRPIVEGRWPRIDLSNKSVDHHIVVGLEEPRRFPIKGVLLDPLNKPVPNATVKINSSMGETMETLTDRNGAFGVVVPEDYTLFRVSLPDYSSLRHEVDVQKGQSIILVLSEHPSLTCNVQGIDRNMKLIVRLHNEKIGQWRSSVNNGSAIFPKTEQGRALLVVEIGDRENPFEWDKNGTPRFYTFEVNITGGKNISNVNIDPGKLLSCIFVPQMQDVAIAQESVIVLWGKWRNAYYIAGMALVKDGKACISVANSGDYFSEIIIPSGTTEAKYEKGSSYYGSIVSLKGNGESLTILFDKETKHTYTGMYRGEQKR